MARRMRLFLWRHQRLLTILYVGILALVWAGFLLFAYATPGRYGVGITVVARALAYHDSFEEVKVAREDIRAGHMDDAQLRLERFLEVTKDVQRSQLETHAVVEAHETLSDLHMRLDRPRRAIKLLRDLTERVPLHYRAWYLRGLAEKKGASSSAAAKSLDRAFRLTLNHIDVTEAYLLVLAELPDLEKVVWVADQFARAQQRAVPSAVVKVGVPRSVLERYSLGWAGIPVEHGTFFRQFEARGLTRGNRQVISCPAELFADWPSSNVITVQLRFEHVYRDLRVDALRCRIGAEQMEFALDPQDVRHLHQPNSSREAFVEFDVRLDIGMATDFEILYSCPERRLTDESLAIIDKARANLKPRRS